MTVKDADVMLEKIASLEEKIDRIEKLLLMLIEDEYVTEEELVRIAETDQIVKNKQFDKLIQVK
ncbi:MAG: hypothetical protein ACXADY_15685 [Candidatus Hodarchaeales archaeon]|jgi:hypothetical protein